MSCIHSVPRIRLSHSLLLCNLKRGVRIVDINPFSTSTVSFFTFSNLTMCNANNQLQYYSNMRTFIYTIVYRVCLQVLLNSNDYIISRQISSSHSNGNSATTRKEKHKKKSFTKPSEWSIKLGYIWPFKHNNYNRIHEQAYLYQAYTQTSHFKVILEINYPVDIFNSTNQLANLLAHTTQQSDWFFSSGSPSLAILVFSVPMCR